MRVHHILVPLQTLPSERMRIVDETSWPSPGTVELENEKSGNTANIGRSLCTKDSERE